MIEVREKPLISFVLVAYNQEKYIREAVEGAFSQTYSPLEIILSDDCSTDRTFEIIKEMAEQYHGPHQIKLNHNSRNLGIGSHLNTVFEMCRGEFIVLAAGDDISVGHRTEALWQEWENSGRLAHLVYSHMYLIDKGGSLKGKWQPGSIHHTSVEQSLKLGSCSVFGCTVGFSRELIHKFGPLRSDVVHEDTIIPFRSLLLGSISYINDCLVYYRRHDTNVYKTTGLLTSSFSAFKSEEQRKLTTYQQWWEDVESVPSKTDYYRSLISPHILQSQKTIARLHLPFCGYLYYLYLLNKCRMRNQYSRLMRAVTFRIQAR